MRDIVESPAEIARKSESNRCEFQRKVGMNSAAVADFAVVGRVGRAEHLFSLKSSGMQATGHREIFFQDRAILGLAPFLGRRDVMFDTMHGSAAALVVRIQNDAAIEELPR